MKTKHLFNVTACINGESYIECIHAVDYDDAEKKALKIFKKQHLKIKCIHIIETTQYN